MFDEVKCVMNEDVFELSFRKVQMSSISNEEDVRDVVKQP